MKTNVQLTRKENTHTHTHKGIRDAVLENV